MSGPWLTHLAFLALSYRMYLIGAVVVLAVILTLADGRRRAMHLRWAAGAVGASLLLEVLLRLGQLPFELLALVPIGVPVAYLLRLAGTQARKVPAADRPIRKPAAPASEAPGAARTILPIRSVAEEHLYMDFHPCACGEADWSNLKQSLQMLGPTMASVFAGPCRNCGTRREFWFQVPDPEAQRFDGSFGGPEPSAILDPGQFLVESDRCAKAVPASVSGLDETARRKAAATLQRSIAALEEVLKFIPPGADEVPKSAFRSAESARILEQLPGQFQRLRLNARLQAYRDLLQQFGS